MDFEINDDQRLLVDSVRRWLDRDYTFADFRRFASDASQTKSTWSTMAELGLLSVNIAEGDGGLGGGSVETLLVMQLFGRALLVDPFVSHAVIAVALINAEAPSARRTALLQKIAAGSERVTVAVLEPQRRFDLTPLDMQATPTESGFLLSGRKAVVMHGDSASLFIVSARVVGREPHSGATTLFLVEANALGIEIRGFPTIDGQRAAEITFTKVRVDSAAVLGRLHEGAEILEWAIDRGIAALCAEAVGAMEKLLELTAEHLRTRKQFGQPIGKFQALQHRVAEMAIALEQSRSMALMAAAKIDSADRNERRQAASAAKAMVGRCGRFIGQQAVQLHGGMGMTDEVSVGYYFKRLTAIDMSWGNTEHHTELYGEIE